MICINYGVPKSGSTFTFELTRRLLEECGHEQIQLSAEIRQDRRGRDHYNNAIRDWTDEVVSAIEQAVPPNTITLLRTHHRASPAVAALIEKGAAKHIVGIRDPRDIALSMLDVASRLEEQGRTHENVRPGELQSAMPWVKKYLDMTTEWAKIPGALVVNYEQTAFSFSITLDEISGLLGLAPPHHAYDVIYADAVKTVAPKINVAMPYRHRREMRAEDQAIFLEQFKSFYDEFFPGADIIVDEKPAHATEISPIVKAAKEERTRSHQAKEEAREAKLKAKMQKRLAAGSEGGPLDASDASDISGLANAREELRRRKREAARELNRAAAGRER